jgi:murein L,D-transpeptidase YafK
LLINLKKNGGFHVFTIFTESVILSTIFMKIKSVIALVFATALVGFTIDSFKKQQLKYTTVRTAYNEKWTGIKDKLVKAGVDTNGFNIFIRVFKQEAKLEVWAKSTNIAQYKLVETYPICRSSGGLGPKRRQGDGQVPEGFYQVESFNPQSEFYMALRVNYPNKADLLKATTGDPGGDIMIHGNCVTIGCMPLTDDKIKEVYVMAVEARNNGQQTIPIHIFPTQLNEQGMKQLKGITSDTTKINFWNNLQSGYAYFETNKLIPKISVTKKGDYKVE